jgi:large subunit ribosomal protein L15
MGTTLHDLTAPPGANRDRMRIGRGLGSGKGKTSGKGMKGQKARTGHHGAIKGFEGGQMPMQRRLPKRGFNNKRFRTAYYAINLGDIAARFQSGTVEPATLAEIGLVPRRAGVRIKVLGDGELAKALTIKAHAFSASAKEKIVKAGGTAEVVAIA